MRTPEKLGTYTSKGFFSGKSREEVEKLFKKEKILGKIYASKPAYARANPRVNSIKG